MKKNIKLLFRIEFINETNFLIKIEKVDIRILYYYDYILYKTNNNYIFKKDNYFHLGLLTCTLPIRIVDNYYNHLYSSNLKFNTNLKMKEFLIGFKNDLEKFSKSDLFMKNPFIDDERKSEDRIAFFQNYWIVY
jgi:hypothetical protein